MDAGGVPIGLAGQGGDALRAELFQPAERAAPGSGVVLVHDAPGPDAGTRAAAARLAAAGHAVLAPDLRSRAGEAADAPLLDRRVLADLEAATARLAREPGVDPERVAALGLGSGGTFAFLLGCHSQRLAAVVDVDGPLRYGELSAERPVEPLELALNLQAPLLALFGGRDERVPPEDVRRLEEVLAQFAKPFELVLLPDRGRAADMDAAWSAILAFLDEHLAGAPARRGSR